jgi:hypothetical protein
MYAIKKVKILAIELDKFPSKKKAIVNFYWDRYGRKINQG